MLATELVAKQARKRELDIEIKTNINSTLSITLAKLKSAKTKVGTFIATSYVAGSFAMDIATELKLVLQCSSPPLQSIECKQVLYVFK